MPAGAFAGGIAQPGEELGAVLEEEEGQHQHNEEGDQDGGSGADTGKDGTRDGASALLQPGSRFIDVAAHILAIEVKGWALCPELQALDAGDRLQVQRAGLAHEVRGNEGNESTHCRERNQNGYGSRQRGGEANAAQLLSHWG